MLELKDIRKTFNLGTINEKKALNGVSITLNDGDFVTIIGGNGAGKSTTLNAVAGVWAVDSGAVIINGKDVTSLPEHKRAAFIGRVFQDPMTGTAATMEIQENLALAARRGNSRRLRWGITKKEKEEYHKLLKTLGLGLEDRMSSKVGLLSGGQRQATAMMVTHNMSDAIKHGNRLIMMNDGVIIYDVKGEEKKKLTVDALLKKFEEVSGNALSNDRMLFSGIEKKMNFLRFSFFFIFLQPRSFSVPCPPSAFSEERWVLAEDYSRQ